MRQSSTRLLVAIAAIFGFRVRSHDVRQAYLQSAQKLMRKVYLKPSKEFEMSENELLELLKPLYGLSDSGDYWNRTMTNHLKEDIGMDPTDGDLSLFFKHVESKLIGMTGTYVDDSLHCGTTDFMQLCDKSLDKFESREREMDNTTFAGVKVKTVENGFELSQEQYVKKIKVLSTDCSFKEFRSLRHQLAWLTHTRPEICCTVNMAAQVTETKFSSDHIKAINRVVKHVKEHPTLPLKYQRLDKDSLKLKVYSDSSFANNDDHSSQLGYIVLLVDKTNKCNILHLSSHKSRRVTQSVLGGEVYAFADAFDIAYIMKHDLESITGKCIPLTMLTDSKSLFDVIAKCSTILERRLMIDISVVRQAYDREEISNVGFVRTKDNPADAFTKVCDCDALNQIVLTATCDLPIEQWVIRDKDAT